MARGNPGLIPDGYISIKELYDRTFAALPDEKHRGDEAMWRLVPFFIMGVPTVHFSGPMENGKFPHPPAEYWKPAPGDSFAMGELAIVSGVYDNPPPEHAKFAERALFVSVNGADSVIKKICSAILESDAIDPAAFDKPNWSQLQTLAWVCSRDRGEVCKFAPGRKNFGYRWEQHKFSDYKDSKLVRIANARPGVFDIEMGDDYEDFEAAEANVRTRLQQGLLSATGRCNGEGPRAEIEPMHWLDISFRWGDDKRPDYVGINSQKVQPFWADVYFSKDAILSEWPEGIAEDAAETPTTDKPKRRNKPGRKVGPYYAEMVTRFSKKNDEQLSKLEESMQPGSGRKKTAIDWQKTLADFSPPKNWSDMAGKMVDALKDAKERKEVQAKR
jgi:hypothetical protein